MPRNRVTTRPRWCLPTITERGQPELPRNLAEAARWYSALAQDGEPVGQYSLVAMNSAVQAAMSRLRQKLYKELKIAGMANDFSGQRIEDFKCRGISGQRSEVFGCEVTLVETADSKMGGDRLVMPMRVRQDFLLARRSGNLYYIRTRETFQNGNENEKLLLGRLGLVQDPKSKSLSQTLERKDLD